MTKRITPSVSTASKQKCRDNVVIEARGLSSAPMAQPSTAPQRPARVDPSFLHPRAQAEVADKSGQRNCPHRTEMRARDPSARRSSLRPVAHGPSGGHLIALARTSGEVLGAFLAMAGREDLMLAIKRAAEEEAIADLRCAVRQLGGDRQAPRHETSGRPLRCLCKLRRHADLAARHVNCPAPSGVVEMIALAQRL
jgi:hypothetical protein